MAEVLVSFDQPVRDELGEYHARAVGRAADDGMWEGWIEFRPIDGAPKCRDALKRASRNTNILSIGRPD